MPVPLDIVIPAAGAGRRMRSFGPKSLIPLGTETVIGRQIRLLRAAYPGARIIVVAGFEHQRLRRVLPRSVRMVKNLEFETTNVARSIAIGLAETKPGRSVLVVYGDLVFSPEVIAGLSIKRSSIVVCESEGREAEVGVMSVDGNATCLSYGLPQPWAHVVMMAPAEKELFLKSAAGQHRDKHFGFEILNDVIDQGGSFAVTTRKARLVEIDTSKDIEPARKIS